jgi:hypothetical protein
MSLPEPHYRPTPIVSGSRAAHQAYAATLGILLVIVLAVSVSAGGWITVPILLVGVGLSLGAWRDLLPGVLLSFAPARYQPLVAPLAAIVTAALLLCAAPNGGGVVAVALYTLLIVVYCQLCAEHTMLARLARFWWWRYVVRRARW